MITQYYGPTYEKLLRDRTNHYTKKIREEYSIGRDKLWIIIRRWLQSGFNPASLIDKRSIRYLDNDYEVVNGKIKHKATKNNQRLSEQDLKYFAEALKQYKSGKQNTYKGVYNDMINNHYREKVVDGDTIYFKKISNAPTKRQFLYYCHNNMTQEEYDKAKMDAWEQRNNKRILTGSSRTGVTYPGEVVEVDEVDNRVSLVSKFDHSKTIGNPCTYCMVDVLTGAIVAVGVALNQNSYVGLTNMFLNLSEDKVAYCAKYGINIKAEDWPSNFIPTTIRSDRGADFKGNDILEVCKKLNIERNLEPAATGSMKGLVENSFHTIQAEERELFEPYGLITKDYNNEPHTNAMLTLDEYTKVLLLLVLKHNKRIVATNYRTPAMIESGVYTAPNKLWEYCCEHTQKPQPITNLAQYTVSLMKEGKASVNRKGVKFLKRNYLPAMEDDPDLYNLMYESQNKSKRIDILYDPRCMDYIYRVHNGKLIALPMNMNKPENNGFKGLSEQEVEYYNKLDLQLRKQENKENAEIDSQTRLLAQQAIEEAYKPTRPSKKNLRENRHYEKGRIAQDNYSLADKLNELGLKIPSNDNDLQQGVNEESKQVEEVSTQPSKKFSIEELKAKRKKALKEARKK